MKNGFRSFGKAILYALAYLLIQNLVGLVYTITVDFSYFLKHPDILHLGPSQIASLIEYMHAGNSGLHIILPLFLSNLAAVLLMWLFFAVRKKKFSQEIGLHKISGKNLAAAIVFGSTFSIVLTAAIAQLTQNVTGIPFWSVGVCLAGLVLVIIYLIRNNRRKPVSAVFPAET